MGVTVDLGADIKPKARLGVRHVQAVLLFFVWVLNYGMRTNMSLAIVVMTDEAHEEHLDWSLQIKSVILSSFFWCYMILQIPGGVLASKYGGSLLITIALIINSLSSIFIPYAAYYGGWQLVCSFRVLQGLTQGLAVPATHSMIGKWVPVPEQSRMTAFIYSGVYLGTAIQFTLSGFIADKWGWPAIFYTNGACGAICLILFIIFGASSPEISKYISKEERLYIQTSLGQVGKQKKLSTPWKAIFTSVPFLASFIAHCGDIWGYSTMMTEMPSYMKKVLGINIKANGVLSAIPYLAMYVLSFVFGVMSDFLINNGYLSITATRKFCNSIGAYGPAIGLLVLSYTSTDNVVTAIALLSVLVALSVGSVTGTVLVFLDIAPNFAGVLLGTGNGIANIGSLIAPLVAGAVMNDETDPYEWRKVFFIAAAVYVLGNTVYLIFGTSDKQKWNDPDSDTQDLESTNTKEK